jgi:hypothetical protein
VNDGYIAEIEQARGEGGFLCCNYDTSSEMALLCNDRGELLGEFFGIARLCKELE